MSILPGTIRSLRALSSGLWVGVSNTFRAGSGLASLTRFLSQTLFIVGIVLVLLGFDLIEIDRWLEGQAGTIEGAGSLLFRLFCGLILLICAFAVTAGLFQMVVRLYRKLFGSRAKEQSPVMQRKRAKEDDEQLGCGFTALAVVVGYFAYFGTLAG